jgi:quaternary ammonium compound-resistance protein SugE
MAWIALFIAGLFETGWAIAMKASDGFSRPLPTVLMLICMVVSMVLLTWSLKELPIGTAYMVWTGIGAVGAFVLGIFLFGESVTPLRIIAATIIVSGIALMKFAEG